ncbi:MAG: transposase [Saprospiraceae bacterium]|nr:transposase [Candidatus Vicinibacter proximus]
MSKLRRKFTKEQKLEIVIMSLEDNQSVIEVAERFALSRNVLYNWRRQYGQYSENAFPGHGKYLGTDQEKELTALRNKVSKLEIENEILK